MAVAARVAVVGGPVHLGRHLAHPITCAPQQVDPLVVRHELHVVEPLRHYLSVQGLAERRLDLQPDDGGGLGPALDRAEEFDEIRRVGIADVAWRHALQRNAVADQLRELLAVAGRQALRKGGTHLAAVAVAAVAARAAALKCLASRIDGLGVKGGRRAGESESAK